MFEYFKVQFVDKIFVLMVVYCEDFCIDKIDFGVGVYKDVMGLIFVMCVVKKVEQKILEEQNIKVYVFLVGDIVYFDVMIGLVLDGVVLCENIVVVVIFGGIGVICQVFELIKQIVLDVIVWYINLIWLNYVLILNYLDMLFKVFVYFDEVICLVDFDGMMVDLVNVQVGDVILFYGCCYNLIGVNLIVD